MVKKKLLKMRPMHRDRIGREFSHMNLGGFEYDVHVYEFYERQPGGGEKDSDFVTGKMSYGCELLFLGESRGYYEETWKKHIDSSCPEGIRDFRRAVAVCHTMANLKSPYQLKEFMEPNDIKWATKQKTRSLLHSLRPKARKKATRRKA